MLELSTQLREVSTVPSAIGSTFKNLLRHKLNGHLFKHHRRKIGMLVCKDHNRQVALRISVDQTNFWSLQKSVYCLLTFPLYSSLFLWKHTWKCTCTCTLVLRFWKSKKNNQSSSSSLNPVFHCLRRRYHLLGPLHWWLVAQTFSLPWLIVVKKY